MGQRLVINVYEKDEKVANAYYHWSGYTLSSLEILKDISRAYAEDKNMSAVDLLKTTGAKLADDENCDRNEGIIETTEEGMYDSSRWSEGDIHIYLDENRFDFDVIMYQDKDDIKYDLENYWENIELKDIKQLGFDLENLPLDDIDTIENLSDKFAELEDICCGLFKYGKEYYQMIF